ncbi:MAG: response regulator [Rhodospirillaceae bacterium]|nr:response regulator [Rhodospirillaceae bacterium]MBT5192706.1 response regulator [Rhodospirillaceae bacterium]MBT5895436.1 response regulator [Rhodospirillaceae bacterium]MBT6431269.1 response regulator [Rhodospirillaceae bacterium]
MGDMDHIVVVDDEQDIRDTLREYLEIKNFRVTPAMDGAALREIIGSGETIDLIILDISMPGEDGLTLARFIRESSDVPIIMLTAANDVMDRIVGLEMGADDYLSKPVDLRELFARVKTILRRTRLNSGDGALAATPKQQIRVGSCHLDLDAHRLFDKEGAEIAITAMEYDLLRAFVERPNRVLTRDQLLEFAHHKNWEPFDRSIDIRIARLRRKIETDPTKPRVIKTVRGMGYTYAPQ